MIEVNCSWVVLVSQDNKKIIGADVRFDLTESQVEEFTNTLKLNKRVLIIPEEDIEIMQRLYREQFPERFV